MRSSRDDDFAEVRIWFGSVVIRQQVEQLPLTVRMNVAARSLQGFDRVREQGTVYIRNGRMPGGVGFVDT